MGNSDHGPAYPYTARVGMTKNMGGVAGSKRARRGGPCWRAPCASHPQRAASSRPSRVEGGYVYVHKWEQTHIWSIRYVNLYRFKYVRYVYSYIYIYEYRCGGRQQARAEGRDMLARAVRLASAARRLINTIPGLTVLEALSPQTRNSEP